MFEVIFVAYTIFTSQLRWEEYGKSIAIFINTNALNSVTCYILY